MSEPPRQKVLLFIHGIRNDDPERKWLAAIDEALRREGTETLRERGYRVLAPSYLEYLTSQAPTGVEQSKVTYFKGTDEQYNKAAAEYWSALADLERTGLRGHVAGAGWLGNAPADTIAGPAMALLVKDAGFYCQDADRRHAIFARILAQIPEDADLVIVAHSLGTVVAADLIYRLPLDCELRMVITLGSPLGLEVMRRHLTRKRERFPFEITGPWINVSGTSDVVTGFRGLSPVFPEPLDVFVSTGSDPRHAHDATAYLDDSTVARALAWLDGRHEANHQGAAATNLPDLLADDGVVSIVAGAQYALRLEQQQTRSERRSRFAGARNMRATDVAVAAAEWGDGHPILRRLALDNFEFLHGRVDAESALNLLLSAWSSNPIMPYEIKVPDEVRSAALDRLALDLDLPTIWPRVVREVDADARSAHAGGWNWSRAALVVAGAAAVVAAPALVLAAAPAGLAGGAAIVAGLAALGPGGMLGGVGIVSLVGGTGGAVAARALTAGSAAQVEENVIRLQATALGRRELGIKRSGSPEWAALVAMEDVVTDDHARLARFSDGGSPQLKEFTQKLRSIRAALGWFVERSLDPGRLGPAVETAV